MRIFVTGATGVLGKRVVQKLLAEGHQLTALCRSVANYQTLERQGIRPVWGNIYDAEEMKSVTVGQEVIMHLASSVPVNNQKLGTNDWLANDLLREKGTDSLAQAAVANGVKLFVVPGVMLAYGNHNGKLVKETTPLAAKVPGDLQSAIRMEEITQSYVRKSGLPAVVLRMGMLYAEDSRHTLALIDQLHNQEATIIGKGDTYWNMIHADDAANAIVQVVKHYGIHIGETYNICDGMPVQAKEYIEYMAATIGAPAPKPMRSLPAWFRLGKDNVKAVQLSFQAKNDKAVQKLKWRPVFGSYKEGLTEIVSKLSAKLDQKAA